jgi:hypothetical protein
LLKFKTYFLKSCHPLGFTLRIADNFGVDQNTDFAQERLRRLEKMVHQKTADGKWMCSLCPDVAYARRNAVYNHIEEVHLKIYSYTCHYCDKQFFSRKKRIDHIFYNHREQNKRSKLPNPWF